MGSLLLWLFFFLVLMPGFLSVFKIASPLPELIMTTPLLICLIDVSVAFLSPSVLQRSEELPIIKVEEDSYFKVGDELFLLNTVDKTLITKGESKVVREIYGSSFLLCHAIDFFCISNTTDILYVKES